MGIQVYKKLNKQSPKSLFVCVEIAFLTNDYAALHWRDAGGDVIGWPW